MKTKVLDIKRTVYKVSDFLSWQKAETLNLSPSFQRRPVWQPGAKSYLIDTIVRGLPIPIIFLREQKTDLYSYEPRREVVDGQQRIRTLVSYIDSNLLKDFKPNRDSFTVKAIHNKELAGKTFTELSTDIQQSILDYEFSVHILPSQLDDREVLQIFSRMNATGVRLNSQELRNADYFGKFKTTMYEIAAEQLNRWRKWNIFTEYNIARMLEVELTSEFAIIMLEGLVARSQKKLDKVYKEYDDEFPECEEITRRFNIIMDSIDDKLGDYIGNSPFSNKTLFHILFALVYDFKFGINSDLNRKIKPSKLDQKTIINIKDIGERINNKSLPEKELQILTGRQKNKQFIVTLFNYLKQEIISA